MKKTAATVIALMILCTTSVFALNISEKAHYVGGSDTISVEYSGYTQNAQATMLAYDVSNLSVPLPETPLEDITRTPIIGISQKSADGSFSFTVPTNFSGRIVLLIGGEGETPIRVLLEVDGGTVYNVAVPGMVEKDFNAGGSIYTLKDGDTVTLSGGAKIMNALIDASQGSVVTGSTVLCGKIGFNENGEIYASADSVLKMTAPSAKEGTINYGFLKKTAVSKGESEKTFVFDISGRDSLSKTITFDPIYEGEVQFGFVMQNVPEDVTITLR